MLRVIRWVAIGLIAVLAIVVAVVQLGIGSRLPDGGLKSELGLPGQIAVGGPFSLTDTAGRPVTDVDFRGRWLLVMFGYSTCPDVCPTELQAVAAAMEQLGAQAAAVVPVFITIDPERDTPRVLGSYVKLFDDRLVGLTGTQAQVAAAARAYRVYYAKVPAKAGQDYLMDHSSFLYLMGPDGKLRLLIKPDSNGADIAASIKSRMSTS